MFNGAGRKARPVVVLDSAPGMQTAHLGHWSTSLVYFGPVAVLVGYLGVQSWRDRRRSREGED